jgi:NAD(P)-dependent dehydrogenase (short-subunit alcohol dehydrogenase family)
MTNRLEDKVAVVTGASRGIGEAIARACAAEGARVAIASRKIDGLEPVAKSIRDAGGHALAIAAHMGREEDVAHLFERASAELGGVDILVNNAATNPHFGPMLTLDWPAWDKTFEVNLKGYFAATRALVLHLRERTDRGDRTASVINIASVLGTMGAPMQGIYGMTKAAVISMTKTLAYELGADAVRVNAIAPGLVQTRFAAALIDNDPIRNMVLDRTALKRVAQPHDISGAAVFLASDEAAYVTGSVLTVDGGWTTS